MPTRRRNNRRRGLSLKTKYILLVGLCELISSCVNAPYTHFRTKPLYIENAGILENGVMKLASETNRMAILYKMAWAIGIIIIALHQRHKIRQFFVQIFSLIIRVIIGMEFIATVGFTILCSDGTQMKILKLYLLNLALEYASPTMMSVLYII